MQIFQQTGDQIQSLINNNSNTPTKVQLVIDREDLESVIRAVVNDTIAEKEKKEVPKERFMTSSQVAQRLGVTKTTLWRWEKENYLKPVRFGSKLRYRESDILALMEGQDNG